MQKEQIGERILKSGEATEMTGKNNTDKINSVTPLINGATLFIIRGLTILLLMPLIAELYKNYEFSMTGTAHFEWTQYVTEWPLKGIVIIGIGYIVFGIANILIGWKQKKM